MTERKAGVSMAALASLGFRTSTAADPPAHSPQGAVTCGEGPAVETRLDQADIDAGLVSFNAFREHGRLLFDARFFGRTGAPRVHRFGCGEWCRPARFHQNVGARRQPSASATTCRCPAR